MQNPFRHWYWLLVHSLWSKKRKNIFLTRRRNWVIDFDNLINKKWSTKNNQQKIFTKKYFAHVSIQAKKVVGIYLNLLKIKSYDQFTAKFIIRQMEWKLFQITFIFSFSLWCPSSITNFSFTICMFLYFIGLFLENAYPIYHLYIKIQLLIEL